MTKQDLISYCLHKENTYEDYPFGPEWALMRHKANKTSFAAIFEHSFNNGEAPRLCINLKCEPELAEFLREQYKDIIPAYHMNKLHWNTVIMGGDVPDAETMKFIDMSYEMTKPKRN